MRNKILVCAFLFLLPMVSFGQVKIGPSEETIERLKRNYDDVGEYFNGYCWVKKDFLFGVVDVYGDVIIPISYSNLKTNYGDYGVGVSTKNGKWGVVGIDNKIKIPIEYDKITIINEGNYVCLKKSGKWGFADMYTGEIIVPVSWSNIIYNNQVSVLDYVWVDKGDGTFFYYDIASQRILFPETEGYSETNSFNEQGYACVKKGSKYGAVLKDGSIFVDFEYKKTEKVEERAKELIEQTLAAYKRTGEFKNGMSWVEKDGKYGVINLKGEVVIPIKYEDMNPNYIDKMGFAVKQNGKYGVVSFNNEQRIPFEYDYIIPIIQGEYIGVKNQGKWGLMDYSGEVYLPIEWLNVGFNSKAKPFDYVWVQNTDSLYYYYDLNAQTIRFPEKGQGFSDAWNFNSNGYALVKKGSHYGAVLRDGSFFLPCRFNSAKDAYRVVEYLGNQGLRNLDDVNLMSLDIKLRGTSNKYKLIDVVPENEWDY